MNKRQNSFDAESTKSMSHFSKLDIAQNENQLPNEVDYIKSVSEDSIAKNKIPRRIKKTLYCSLLLLILGLVLTIVGIEKTIRTNDFTYLYSLVILGVILLIPGVFYIVKFTRAKCAKDEELRREILEDIPEV